MTYRVNLRDRASGALGVFTDATIELSWPDRNTLIDEVRRRREAEGREHVLVLTIYVGSRLVWGPATNGFIS